MALVNGHCRGWADRFDAVFVSQGADLAIEHRRYSWHAGKLGCDGSLPIRAGLDICGRGERAASLAILDSDTNEGNNNGDHYSILEANIFLAFSSWPACNC